MGENKDFQSLLRLAKERQNTKRGASQPKEEVVAEAPQEEVVESPKEEIAEAPQEAPVVEQPQEEEVKAPSRSRDIYLNGRRVVNDAIGDNRSLSYEEDAPQEVAPKEEIQASTEVPIGIARPEFEQNASIPQFTSYDWNNKQQQNAIKEANDTLQGVYSTIASDIDAQANDIKQKRGKYESLKARANSPMGLSSDENKEFLRLSEAKKQGDLHLDKVVSGITESVFREMPQLNEAVQNVALNSKEALNLKNDFEVAVANIKKDADTSDINVSDISDEQADAIYNALSPKEKAEMDSKVNALSSQVEQMREYYGKLLAPIISKETNLVAGQLQGHIISELAKKDIPQSALEYILRGAISSNSLTGSILLAGSGDSALEKQISAQGNQMYDASTLTKMAEEVATFAVDGWAFGLGGKAGLIPMQIAKRIIAKKLITQSAGKMGTALANNIASKYISQKTLAKVGTSLASGATSFGGHTMMHEALNTMIDNGEITSDDAKQIFKNASKSALNGMLLSGYGHMWEKVPKALANSSLSGLGYLAASAPVKVAGLLGETTAFTLGSILTSEADLTNSEEMKELWKHNLNTVIGLKGWGLANRLVKGQLSKRGEYINQAELEKLNFNSADARALKDAGIKAGYIDLIASAYKRQASEGEVKGNEMEQFRNVFGELQNNPNVPKALIDKLYFGITGRVPMRRPVQRVVISTENGAKVMRSYGENGALIDVDYCKNSAEAEHKRDNILDDNALRTTIELEHQVAVSHAMGKAFEGLMNADDLNDWCKKNNTTPEEMQSLVNKTFTEEKLTEAEKDMFNKFFKEFGGEENEVARVRRQISRDYKSAMGGKSLEDILTIKQSLRTLKEQQVVDEYIKELTKSTRIHRESYDKNARALKEKIQREVAPELAEEVKTQQDLAEEAKQNVDKIQNENGEVIEVTDGEGEYYVRKGEVDENGRPEAEAEIVDAEGNPANVNNENLTIVSRENANNVAEAEAQGESITLHTMEAINDSLESGTPCRVKVGNDVYEVESEGSEFGTYVIRDEQGRRAEISVDEIAEVVEGRPTPVQEAIERAEQVLDKDAEARAEVTTETPHIEVVEEAPREEVVETPKAEMTFDENGEPEVTKHSAEDTIEFLRENGYSDEKIKEYADQNIANKRQVLDSLKMPNAPETTASFAENAKREQTYQKQKRVIEERRAEVSKEIEAFENIKKLFEEDAPQEVAPKEETVTEEAPSIENPVEEYETETPEPIEQAPIGGAREIAMDSKGNPDFTKSSPYESIAFLQENGYTDAEIIDYAQQNIESRRQELKKLVTPQRPRVTINFSENAKNLRLYREKIAKIESQRTKIQTEIEAFENILKPFEAKVKLPKMSDMMIPQARVEESPKTDVKVENTEAKAPKTDVKVESPKAEKEAPKTDVKVESPKAEKEAPKTDVAQPKVKAEVTPTESPKEEEEQPKAEVKTESKTKVKEQPTAKESKPKAQPKVEIKEVTPKEVTEVKAKRLERVTKPQESADAEVVATLSPLERKEYDRVKKNLDKKTDPAQRQAYLDMSLDKAKEKDMTATIKAVEKLIDEEKSTPKKNVKAEKPKVESPKPKESKTKNVKETKPKVEEVKIEEIKEESPKEESKVEEVKTEAPKEVTETKPKQKKTKTAKAEEEPVGKTAEQVKAEHKFVEIPEKDEFSNTSRDAYDHMPLQGKALHAFQLLEKRRLGKGEKGKKMSDKEWKQVLVSERLKAEKKKNIAKLDALAKLEAEMENPSLRAARYRYEKELAYANSQHTPIRDEQAEYYNDKHFRDVDNYLTHGRPNAERLAMSVNDRGFFRATKLAQIQLVTLNPLINAIKNATHKSVNFVKMIAKNPSIRVFHKDGFAYAEEGNFRYKVASGYEQANDGKVTHIEGKRKYSAKPKKGEAEKYANMSVRKGFIEGENGGWARGDRWSPQEVLRFCEGIREDIKRRRQYLANKFNKTIDGVIVESEQTSVEQNPEIMFRFKGDTGDVFHTIRLNDLEELAQWSRKFDNDVVGYREVNGEKFLFVDNKAGEEVAVKVGEDKNTAEYAWSNKNKPIIADRESDNRVFSLSEENRQWVSGDVEQINEKTINTLANIAKAFGLEIEFKDLGDKANGMFTKGGKKIYLNSRLASEYETNPTKANHILVATFGHEFLHYLKDINGKHIKEYRTIVDDMKAHYAERYQRLFNTTKERYKAFTGKDMSNHAVVEELTANYIGEQIFDNPNFLDDFNARTKGSARKFLLKVKNAMKGVIIDLKSKITHNPAYRETYAKAKRAERKLYALCDKTMAEIKERAIRDQKSRNNLFDITERDVVEENGVLIASRDLETNEIVFNNNLFAERQWLDISASKNGKYYQEKIKEACKKGGLTAEQGDAILDFMNRMADYAEELGKDSTQLRDWNEVEVVLGDKGEPVLSFVIPDSEYKYNVGMSLVCKKRRALDAVLRRLIHDDLINKLPNSPLTIQAINNIIKEAGLETGCQVCYVEARRFRSIKNSDTFINGDGKKKIGWNNLIKSLDPEGKFQSSHFNFGENAILRRADDKASKRGKTLAEADDSELDFTLVDKVIKDYEASQRVKEAKKQGVKIEDPDSEEALGLIQYKQAKAIRDSKKAWYDKDGNAVKDRQPDPKLGDKYISAYRQLLDRGDFMDSKGFTNAKKVQHNPTPNDILKFFNGAFGASNPKNSLGDRPYNGEFMNGASFKPANLFQKGGVRMQSFDDFLGKNWFDYLHAHADAAIKGLPIHTYTKEEAFVKLYGMTGNKINMSAVPDAIKGAYAGLDLDGNYLWHDGFMISNTIRINNGKEVPEGIIVETAKDRESIDFEQAKYWREQEGYRDNCGIIAIGASDQHIWKMMNDVIIDMIIPYHKSNLNPAVSKAMGGLDLFTDYTSIQNERKLDGTKLSQKDKAKVPNINLLMCPKEFGGKGMTPDEAIEYYVRYCEDNAILPKFDKFCCEREGNTLDGKEIYFTDVKGVQRRKIHSGYYKMIIDFKVKAQDENGNTYNCLQKAVEFKMPADFPKYVREATMEWQGVMDSIDDKMPSMVKQIEDTIINGDAVDKLEKEKDLANEKREERRVAEHFLQRVIPYSEFEDMWAEANGQGKTVYEMLRDKANKGENVFSLESGLEKDEDDPNNKPPRGGGGGGNGGGERIPTLDATHISPEEAEYNTMVNHYTNAIDKLKEKVASKRANIENAVQYLDLFMRDRKFRVYMANDPSVRDFISLWSTEKQAILGAVKEGDKKQANERLIDAVNRLNNLYNDVRIKKNQQMIWKALDTKTASLNQQGNKVGKLVDDATRTAFENIKNAINGFTERYTKLDGMSSLTEESTERDFRIASVSERFQEAYNHLGELRDGVAEMETKIAELNAQIKEARKNHDNKQVTILKEQRRAFEQSLSNAREDVANAYEGVNKVVNTLYGEGRGAFLDAKGKKQESKANFLKKAFSSIFSGKHSVDFHRDGGKEITPRGNNNALKTLFSRWNYAAASFNSVLKTLCRNDINGERGLYEDVMTNYVEARQRLYNEKESYYQRMTDFIKNEVGGSDWHDTWKNAVKKSNKVLEGQSIVTLNKNGMPSAEKDLTIGEAMQMIATYRQERGKIMIENSILGEGETAEQYNACLESGNMADHQVKVAKLMTTLENDLKAKHKGMYELLNFVQNDLMPETGVKYNERYLERYGIQLTKEKNYFPLKVNSRDYKETLDIQNNGGRLVGNNPSATKERVMHSHRIDFDANAIETIAKYYDEMERDYQLGGLIERVNSLLSNKSFQAQFKQQAGSTEAEQGERWSRFIDLTKKAFETSDDGQDKMGKISSFIYRNAVSANVAFKLHTALKQITSYPAYLAYAPSVKLASNLVGQWVHSKANIEWAIKNLPTFRERWQKRDAGNEAFSYVKEGKNWYDDAIATMAKTGITPNAWMDCLTCANGAKSLYDYQLKKNMEVGMSYADAKQNALDKAAIYMNETQQSSLSAMLSLRQGNGRMLDRMLTAYRNANLGYLRKEIESWQAFTKNNAIAIAERSKYYDNIKSNFDIDDVITANRNAYKEEGMSADEIAKRIKEDKEAYQKFLETSSEDLAKTDAKDSRKKAALGAVVFSLALNTLWMLAGKDGVIKYFLDDDDIPFNSKNLAETTDEGAIFKNVLTALSVAPLTSNIALAPILQNTGEAGLSTYSNSRSIVGASEIEATTKIIRRVIQGEDKEIKNYTDTDLFTALCVATRWGAGVDGKTIERIAHGVHGIIRDGVQPVDILNIINTPESAVKLIVDKRRPNETRQGYLDRLTFEYRRMNDVPLSDFDKKFLRNINQEILNAEGLKMRDYEQYDWYVRKNAKKFGITESGGVVKPDPNNEYKKTILDVDIKEVAPLIKDLRIASKTGAGLKKLSPFIEREKVEDGYRELLLMRMKALQDAMQWYKTHNKKKNKIDNE